MQVCQNLPIHEASFSPVHALSLHPFLPVVPFYPRHLPPPPSLSLLSPSRPQSARFGRRPADGGRRWCFLLWRALFVRRLARAASAGGRPWHAGDNDLSSASGAAEVSRGRAGSQDGRRHRTGHVAGDRPQVGGTLGFLKRCHAGGLVGDGVTIEHMELWIVMNFTLSMNARAWSGTNNGRRKLWKHPPVNKSAEDVPHYTNRHFPQKLFLKFCRSWAAAPRGRGGGKVPAILSTFNKTPRVAWKLSTSNDPPPSPVVAPPLLGVNKKIRDTLSVELVNVRGY